MERGPVDGTRWTVIGETEPRSDGQRMRRRVRVQCVCGETRVLLPLDLTARNFDGSIRSSGCGNSKCKAIWSVAQRFRAGGYPATAAEFEARIAELLAESRLRDGLGEVG